MTIFRVTKDFRGFKQGELVCLSVYKPKKYTTAGILQAKKFFGEHDWKNVPTYRENCFEVVASN